MGKISAETINQEFDDLTNKVFAGKNLTLQQEWFYEACKGFVHDQMALEPIRVENPHIDVTKNPEIVSLLERGQEDVQLTAQRLLEPVTNPRYVIDFRTQRAEIVISGSDVLPVPFHPKTTFADMMKEVEAAGGDSSVINLSIRG